MSSDIILEMKNITKRFPGVVALDQVSIQVRKGEVHAIVGENGAGKSTLMKIIAGAYRKDGGEICLNHQKIDTRTPLDAQRLGISIIYQEFNLAPHLSAGANIYIGREPRAGIPIFIDHKKIREESKNIFHQLGVKINPDKIVGDLGVCEQQITEIAKALSFDSCILIMDEPTSALPEHEVELLYNVIHRIQKQGVTILFISHNLDDVFRIANTITVLRDGKHIITKPASELSIDQVVSKMVGKDISVLSDHRQKRDAQEVLLETRDLCCGNSIKNINLMVRKGEILGIAGLLGAGRTELLRCIFGADLITDGDIYVEGKKVNIHCPADGVRLGIGFVPEDRKQQGLFLQLAASTNITATCLPDLSRLSIISRKAEYKLSARYIQSLSIRLSSQKKMVNHLSGGNQQKVLIARWLAINPKILLLDDPTRGIDIGARLAIHQLILELAGSGMGVIFVSSELPEVMEISDRILVMSKGQITGDFERKDFSKEKIVTAATGLHKKNGVKPEATDYIHHQEY